MKALITGSSGFVGFHLSRFLKTKKIKAVGVDRKKFKKIDQVIEAEKPDWVFHLASPVLRSDQLMDESLAKNLKMDIFGTVELLQSVAKLKKKPKVLIAGTAAVYKQKKSGVYKESDPVEPKTGYGLSKLTQELISDQLAKSYKIPLIITRSVLFIGSHQKQGFVVNDLVKQVVEIEKGLRKPVLEVGNLEVKRDFMDIRDGVKGFYLVMKKDKAGEIYNVASNQAIAIRKIVDWLKQNSTAKFKIKQKKAWRKNELKIIQADNTKLKSLGWKSEHALDDSLKDILNFWRKNI